MSDDQLTVTIAGITGKFAQLLVRHLLTKPNIRINGTTRDISKAPEELKTNQKITLFQTTSEDVDSLRKALKGANVAVCAYLGWHDVMLDGQKTLIDAAIAEGVSRYVAADFTADFRKLEYGDHEGKDDMKYIAEYLDERQDKIKAIHILNGGFMETVFTPWINFLDSVKDEFKIREGGKNKVEMTTYSDAAAVTAEVIADIDAHGWFQVAGNILDPHEIAKLYGEAYKVNPKLVDIGTFAEAEARLADMKKASPYNPMPWMALNYEIIVWSGKSKLGHLDNDRFPSIKFTTLKEYFYKTKKEDLASAPNRILSSDIID